MFKQNGLIYKTLEEVPFGERFFPIVEVEQQITVADALDSHYGYVMTEAKRLMCEKLAAAEIGGFYIFNDGSELPV